MAIPNATIERVDVDARPERADEHPQGGGVEQPVERGPEQHPPEQLLVLDELIEALGDLREHLRGPFVVDVETPGDPSDRAFGAPGSFHQPEHERRRDPHHDDPDDGDGAVDAD